jgi:tricorn protease
VVFTSPRYVFTNRFTQLFTVPLDGGMESPLPIPNAARGAYSADGRTIAYNPLAPAFLEWKGYRGGRVSTISLFDTRAAVEKWRSQPATPALEPDVAGRHAVFSSNRDGD